MNPEPTNLNQTQSIQSNQIKSNQIKSNQIKSNQIKSNQIKSNQIKSNQIKSNQIKSNQIKSNQIKSNQIKSNQIKSNQIKSNQIKSNQIKSNQIKSNQIKSNQIKSNQIKSNQIKSNHIENLKVISVNKFIFLSLISFGLYPIWWMFKAWRFFLIKDKLNIMPAARAIFSIFFLYSLFNRIKTYAKEQGYINDFSSGWMYLGYLITSLLVRLPDPYWLISLCSIIFLIPAFKALNYAQKQIETTIKQEKFNTPQIILIIIGSIMWLLILFSFVILFLYK
ncbi:tyrosyl-tRNA synthetase [Acinetobacter baumannii]|nr:tyrosyl-tRNA synthetase [Acinetobacter baumannii]WLC42673.1 tyrosyl-tRNA synthetase [Acinetobacter baumannii]SSR27877.1 Tyrosine--tRNA ligase, putative [Acinetobacter baumannii]